MCYTSEEKIQTLIPPERRLLAMPNNVADLVTDWLIDWLIGWLIGWLTDWLIFRIQDPVNDSPRVYDFSLDTAGCFGWQIKVLKYVEIVRCVGVKGDLFISKQICRWYTGR